MTAQSRFRTTRKKIAPRWLTEGDGELVGYSLDLIKDAFVERVRLGLLARFPQQDATGTPGAPDALAAMGRDRRVVKGLSETDASYARRLLAWLDDRKTAGNPFALMQKLAEYTGAGPAFRTVDMHGNWYERAADGTRSFLLKQENWDWDNTVTSERWARFWVIIYPNGLWTSEDDYADPIDWNEEGHTWGTTATSEEVETVRALVADWKPAGTRCVNIIIALDPASFDPTAPEPDGLWGHWSKVVAGVRVPARLSTARYWRGT